MNETITSRYCAIDLKTSENAWHTLRSIFPDGTADKMNFVLFSTSGIHGSYCTIEDVWDKREELRREFPAKECMPIVTILIVQPRLVRMQYFGELEIHSDEEAAWLKQLRATSHAAMAKIGVPS